MSVGGVSGWLKVKTWVGSVNTKEIGDKKKV